MWEENEPARWEDAANTRVVALQKSASSCAHQIHAIEKSLTRLNLSSRMEQYSTIDTELLLSSRIYYALSYSNF